MNSLCCSRRELLSRLGGGVAGVAFADMLNRNGLLAQSRSPLAPKPPQLPAKAKAVISIFCYGGVSHVDAFDPKPLLLKRQGEQMTGVGEVRPTMGTPGGLMPSPWKFRKHGHCGMEISELFPHVAEHADDLALIRSMYAQSSAHGPAIFQMSTGSVLAGHPSVGSWVAYGLGSENENLPGFIVFTDYRGGPINGAPNWGNGYMPAAYQGTPFRDSGDPIVDLHPPARWAVKRTPERQRKWLRLLRELNEKHLDRNPADSELSARIYSYELAFRMQTHVSDAIDISKESPATRKLYGVGEKPTDYFGRQAMNCTRPFCGLLGLDHEKLTYRFNGRDMRLTDVHGRVIEEILA
ncbi:MAG TPA: DUF1501 domain-containing protein [Blastocatellia bacterium]